MKRFHAFGLVVLLALLALPSAEAQQELGKVSVVVQDEAGKPVPNATVQCVNWDNSFPRTEPLTPREQSTSDDGGRASFDGVTLGQAFVRVISGDLGGWFRVQERKPDFPLVIGVGHSTQVIVRDESGQPVEDVLASADGCIPFGKTDKDGVVTVRNHGIGYTPELYFWKAGYAWESVNLPFNPEKVFVTLKPGVVLEGLVLGPDGQPVPDVDISWNSQRSVRSDAKGAFRFPESAIGSKATLYAGAWNRQPPLNGEVTVTLTAPPMEKVTIAMNLAPTAPEQRRGATIRGRVLNADTDKPVRATILLEHSPAFEWPKKEAVTDETGQFTIEHVEGDRVWLCASAAQPTLYTVGGLVEVDLAKNTAADVTIRMSEGCALRGRVLTAEGTPVPSVQVMFRPMGPYYRAIWTSPEGRFEIPGLDGVGLSYSLSVSDPLQRETTLEVGPMAKGDIRSELELRMPKAVQPATLRGAVVDADGKPMANVNLYFHFQGPPAEPSVLSASSDDLGAFSVPIARSGRVNTSAHKVIQTTPSQHDSIDCPVAEGGVFELTEGINQEVRIVVHTATRRLIECGVVDESGQTVRAEVHILHGQHSDDYVSRDGEGIYRSTQIPKEAYVLEVTAPQYQARILFPGTDFQEDGTKTVVTLKKGPFAYGVSVWEAVTGRPATKEAVASTPLAELIRKRELQYFRAALAKPVVSSVPDGRSVVTPSLPAISKVRVVDAKGKAITRILVESLYVDQKKAALLPPESGAVQPITASDGLYPVPLGSSPGCIVSAPGFARVPLELLPSSPDGVQTLVLEESTTLELTVKRVDGKPAAGIPVSLPQAAWYGLDNTMSAMLMRTDAQGLARFTDIAPGPRIFSVGEFKTDMQAIMPVLKPGEARKVTVQLEERQRSHNPLVLLQIWREAERPQPKYPSQKDDVWEAEIRALPKDSQAALIKTVQESLPILTIPRPETRDPALLLGVASALGNRAVAKDLEGIFLQLPDDATGIPLLSNSRASQVATVITELQGDASVPFFEKCAQDDKRGPNSRLAALLAFGQLHSGKSAEAFARLRDAAYGKPGAPAKKETYTHAERMAESAIMTLCVIPGLSGVAGSGMPTNATVNEDYATGTLWMNNVEIQLCRVGAEWLVSEAHQGPVP